MPGPLARRVAAPLAAALVLAAAPGAAEAALPALAVARDSSTETLGADGSLIRSFGAFQFFSLAGRLLAGSGDGGGDTVVVSDAVTGARRFTIRNAFGPVVLGSGRVAFLPDRGGRRDPQGNSVWVRGRGGKIRKLVQFANGPGLPGIQTGLPDAGTTLSLSFDTAGRKLAVAEGNDVDLFFYDVWVVDTRTGAAFRATANERSRFPSLSPGGGRLAFLREEASCGGPAPGYRAGDIVTMPARKGAARTTLLDGTCAVFYTEPRWLSGSEVVAVRLTRTAPGEYENDLVLVQTATRAVTVLDDGGDLFGLSVSPGRRLVGFMRFGGGSALYDVDARTSLELPGAFAPELDGDRAWP